MQPNGKVDINETIKAWADIVIQKFHAKITELKVYDKGNLDHSLIHEMLVNAGADIEKIEFAFKLYGIFVDMGVGKELSKGNSGSIDVQGEDGHWRGTARVPKEWFSKKYYGQVMKLREILLEQYSKAITFSMINTMQADFDQRYNSLENATTVGSLRTVVYRQKSNSRTARNYAKRRQQSGHWSNEHKTWKPGM
jgi:hypothetical protein